MAVSKCTKRIRATADDLQIIEDLVKELKITEAAVIRKGLNLLHFMTFPPIKKKEGDA